MELRAEEVVREERRERGRVRGEEEGERFNGTMSRRSGEGGEERGGG